MRLWSRLLVGLMLCCVGGSGALASKRVALVIGNSNYQLVSTLPNPERDAAAVADLFKSAGFDLVVLKNNVPLSEMRKAVRDFSDSTKDADVAAVYYAGHGIEVNGSNYLIPVDARLERDIDVEDETVSLDRVLSVIEPARQLRLIILDACRDNPFLKTMKRSIATRSVGRGLAQVEPTTSNTLIAFSAKAGSTAMDGDNSNSPFTSALVKHLTTPGLDIRIALGRVRDEVLQTTGQRQEPFVYSSLGGQTFALIDRPAPTQELPSPAQSVSEPAQAWAAIKDATDPSIFEAFIGHYGASFYADLARARLRELAGDLKKPEATAPSGQSGEKTANIGSDKPSNLEDARTKSRKPRNTERQRRASISTGDTEWRSRHHTPQAESAHACVERRCTPVSRATGVPQIQCVNSCYHSHGIN